MPVDEKCRRDIANCGGIEAVDCDNQEAQCQYQPLIAAKAMAIYKLLNVDSRSGVHLGHPDTVLGLQPHSRRSASLLPQDQARGRDGLKEMTRAADPTTVM